MTTDSKAPECPSKPSDARRDDRVAKVAFEPVVTPSGLLAGPDRRTPAEKRLDALYNAVESVLTAVEDALLDFMPWCLPVATLFVLAAWPFYGLLAVIRVLRRE